MNKNPPSGKKGDDSKRAVCYFIICSCLTVVPAPAIILTV